MRCRIEMQRLTKQISLPCGICNAARARGLPRPRRAKSESPCHPGPSVLVSGPLIREDFDLRNRSAEGKMNRSSTNRGELHFSHSHSDTELHRLLLFCFNSNQHSSSNTTPFSSRLDARNKSCTCRCPLAYTRWMMLLVSNSCGSAGSRSTLLFPYGRRVLQRCYSSATTASASCAGTGATTDQPPQAAIYRSGKNNIFFNFATETVLCNLPKHDNILFQWRNETVVTIGRHQNPWTECRLAELEKDNVELVRRVSGGGAVLQDLGCLTFSLIGNAKDYTPSTAASSSLQQFTERNFKLVIRALELSGVPNCSRSGRNDIVFNDAGSAGGATQGGDVFKISGSAFKTMTNPHGEQKLLHHGTLLFDTDFSALGRYLTPAKQKLQAKGIQSVQSRVKNLKEINEKLELEELMGNIEKVFRDEYSSTIATSAPSPTILTPDTPLLTADPVFADVERRMSDWEFRFGQTPSFSHVVGPVRLEKSAEPGAAVWGMFECHLNVDNGKIIDGKVFSDCLLPDAVTKLNERLSGAAGAGGGAGLNYVAEELREYVLAPEVGYTEEERKLVADVATWLGNEMKE